MTSMELRKCAITSMTKLGLYPVIITVGWVINTYQESTYGLYAQYQYGLGGFAFLSVGLPFLIGACCSIVFMVTNRRLLKELILRSAARIGFCSYKSFSSNKQSPLTFDYINIPGLTVNTNTPTTTNIVSSTTGIDVENPLSEIQSVNTN